MIDSIDTGSETIDCGGRAIKGTHPIAFDALGTDNTFLITEAASMLGYDVVFSTGGNAIPRQIDVRSRFPDENNPANLTAMLSAKILELITVQK
jgi:hypothetical protein